MEKDSGDYWSNHLAEIEQALSMQSDGKAEAMLPLSRLEELYRDHPEYGRLMGALLDLKLTLRFCSHDFTAACVIYNRDLHQKRLFEKSPTEVLKAKINFLEQTNSFVLRVRSFWDKAMGLLVLVLRPSEYQKFVSSNSRRRRFREYMEGHLDIETISAIDSLISTLDDKFRTAEAHQSGTLRNWVLREWDANPINTPFGRLLGFHNQSLQFADLVSSLLLELGGARSTQSELKKAI